MLHSLEMVLALYTDGEVGAMNMAYTIIKTAVNAGDKAGEAITLAGPNCRLEVWPFFGFNALLWQVNGKDILYRTPDFETNPVPTRNGHPILFPFPNRLRNGKFAFEGRVYQLPLNDSTGTHAIHGFTPRNAWRVLETGADVANARITGEFQLSQDLPECRECWPADARIRLTYRLFDNRLRVETSIDAADSKPLPFGLGFHPYFTLGGDLATWQLRFAARALWESHDNFPAGQKIFKTSGLRFKKFQVIGDDVLDHLYGDLSTKKPMVELRTTGAKLSISADASFSELLLFTPPHRQAVALEPYTCITNAANLDTQGLDTGWRVLPPGETYTSAVDYTIDLTG